ncbi:MAG: DUF6364 family protein [Solirubrobacteraceae bacterium]
MRTTVDLPDRLLADARTRASLEHTTLTSLLAEGLLLRLEQAPCEPVSIPVSPLGGGLQPSIDPHSNRSLYDAADRADP